MSNLIRISNLTKKYKKNFALDNLNLEIDNGVVVGLLGPNGSGKTTLIKIIAGLVKSYSGEITINGTKPGPVTKSYVSYLPDRNILGNFNKISHCVKYFNKFFEDFDSEKCFNLLESLSLNKDMKISSLSKGMLEKLHLALVLSRNATLYILDEPIAGVDPLARDEILDAIINNIEPDSTMIISTHLVRDIENIFTEVAFISNGKIIEYDNADNIRIKRGMTIDESYKRIFGGENNFVKADNFDDNNSNVDNSVEELLNDEEFIDEEIQVETTENTEENSSTEDIIVNQVFKADHSNNDVPVDNVFHEELRQADVSNENIQVQDNKEDLEKEDENIQSENILIEDKSINNDDLPKEEIINKESTGKENKNNSIEKEIQVETTENPLKKGETIIFNISDEDLETEKKQAEKNIQNNDSKISEKTKNNNNKKRIEVVDIPQDDLFNNFNNNENLNKPKRNSEYDDVRDDILVGSENKNKNIINKNSEKNNFGGDK